MLLKSGTYFKNIYMEEALRQASLALAMHEVPVGALIVLRGSIISSSHNEVVLRNNPTAHAEILAIQKASAVLESNYLVDCHIYTTLEPCPMCAYAISVARISRLYFGAYDAKSGGVDHGPRIFNSSAAHHVPEIYGGFYEGVSNTMLKNFFRIKRNVKSSK